MKPFLADKIKSRENKILVNNEKITSDDTSLDANNLNIFFSNIYNLKIPKYYVEDKLPHSLSRHLNLKAKLKYKNYPSINSFCRRFSIFDFPQIDKNTVLK